MSLNIRYALRKIYPKKLNYDQYIQFLITPTEET